MIYKYEAKSEDGKTVSGTLEAETEQSAASQVRQMGYYPMRFRLSGLSGGTATLGRAPARQSSTTDSGNASSQFIDGHSKPFTYTPYGSWFARRLIYPISTGVSAKDLSIFFREFATMLHAGVPITRCLEAISQNYPTGLLGTAVRRVKAHVEAGDSLTHAFSEFPYLFSELNISMVAAGEEHGALDGMMLRVSEYLEKEFALREMIKRETFMTKIEIVAAIFLPPLFIWVVQGPHAYFQQVVHPALNIAAMILMAFVAIRIALKTDSVRISYDTAKAYLPWFGGTVRMLALAKFARSLASLYAAGVLIPRALEVSAMVTGNAFYSWKISGAVKNLMGGATLSECLRSTGAFPPMFLSMVNTGETTGSLDDMLGKIADFYEDQANTRLQASVKALGVVLLMAMGIVVCIIGMKALGSYIAGLNGIMDSNG
jgi:type II secretory pathway component PulF